MRIVITFLAGMTAGVGLVRITEGLRPSSVTILAMFAAGAVVGLVAGAMCCAPWADGGERTPHPSAAPTPSPRGEGGPMRASAPTRRDEHER